MITSASDALFCYVVTGEVNFDENAHEQSDVWHIEFFAQPRVQAAILELMTNG
jgi:hypothetical protein